MVAINFALPGVGASLTAPSHLPPLFFQILANTPPTNLASKKSGHGLVNMAARAQKIGGRLTLSSHVNEGTRVVLDLPKEAFLAHR